MSFLSVYIVESFERKCIKVEYSVKRQIIYIPVPALSRSLMKGNPVNVAVFIIVIENVTGK